MIDREQLRKIHSQDLPLHVLEQDYIQALFLQKLYSENEELVFKGGTYLKHAYGLDRFSEDLDFTSRSKNVENPVRRAVNQLSDYGVDAEIDKVDDREVSFSCRLRFSGPLYDGTDKTRGSIEIDVSKRKDVILEPEWVRMFFDYPEIRVVNALGLQKKELLAEKLRALSTRNKARDLYDCWYLIQQGTALDKELFGKKLDVVNEDPIAEISITKEIWQDDLRMFLENPPSFQKVQEEVKEKLQEKDFKVKKRN